MTDPLREFTTVWVGDFEFHAPAGERPQPLCLSALELRTGQRLRLWFDGNDVELPFDVSEQTLFVAYYASAEIGCFLALNWPLPAKVLDLYAEFRNATNGKALPCGKNLLGAMAYFGLGAIEAADKEEMRALAMRGGPYLESERDALQEYCQTDVNALAKLLPAMLPLIDMPRALLRGRYMEAAARMEWNGTPIDMDWLALFREHWTEIKSRLIATIDCDYGVFDGGTFKADRWADYLCRNNIPWPRLESGKFSLDDDTFRDMARRYPEQLGPIRELRVTLSQMRLEDLAVGIDNRNRSLLSAFQAKTGRNQPSNTKFIFGTSCWLRSLIRPTEGRAVAYVDWCQQEFGIGAALSGDENMKTAYMSGDPYLEFAKQAGAVPSNATKQSHPTQRSQFKTCVLGVQYGMHERSLAQSLGEPDVVARELLRLHRQTYPAYWRWSQSAVDCAMLFRRVETAFGWRLYVGPDANHRSLANFPCQANGAEMLRMACCLLTERGIQVCAPIHDAVLVEGSADEIDHIVAETQRAMREASEIVLDGFSLRSEAEIIRWPDRFSDERGKLMWDRVTGIVADIIGPGSTPGAPVVGHLDAPLADTLMLECHPVQSH